MGLEPTGEVVGGDEIHHELHSRTRCSYLAK
jgi:hypothetical protein